MSLIVMEKTRVIFRCVVILPNAVMGESPGMPHSGQEAEHGV